MGVPQEEEVHGQITITPTSAPSNPNAEMTFSCDAVVHTIGGGWTASKARGARMGHTASIVAQGLLADAGGAAALNLMLVAEDGHARAAVAVVHQGPPARAVREHRHQRGLAAVHATRHCSPRQVGS